MNPSKVIVGIFVLLVMAGCRVRAFGKPNPDYLNLIDVDACWNGICPGQTSRAEVMRILPTLDIGDPGEIYELDSSNSIRLWLDPIRFEKSDVEVYFARSQDVVDHIIVTPFKPELTLGQILDFLDKPEWVMAMTSCHDYTTAGFELWYKELGILVFTESFKVDLHPEAGEMVLDERLAVGGLIYKGANADEKDTMYGVPSLDAVTKHGYSWPGFDTTLPSFVDCTLR